MRRWFLSYHSPDQALAERLKAALERKDPHSRVFFAPSSLRAGGSWSRALADEIAQADAFIFLVGENGVGDWQVLEYDEALDKRVNTSDFPLVLVLLEGQTAPGLPFLRRLHWIITPDPQSEKDVARLLDAAYGTGATPGEPSELWRYASPYRGLAAMEEKDSDYFFGRDEKTVEVIELLASASGRLVILLGNSGVGKSSLAQAGVLAALKRQAWPERADGTPPWPDAFRKSRRWCFLTLKPGTEPVRALVEPFLRTWQFDAVDPRRAELLSSWVDKLVDGKVTLRDLLDATEARYRDVLKQPEPPAFLLYIDQGEELYVRAEERQRQRFSDVISQGIADPRLHVLMSMRSNFFGELQKDEPLFNVHCQINVPPLREPELRQVVSRPAELLSARFETAELADIITSRTAEDSVKDVGALPLLSYTLDDMWTQMVMRGDGMLRLAAQSFELGGVLVNRADAFLEAHPHAEGQLRRVFTLKLATVREGEEPTRRRAPRSEFSEAQWRLANELADHPYRLLVTATPEGGEAYAEVAHETIFRRWGKLRDWIAVEREFLAWRSGLEAARRTWQTAPDDSKNDALLMGLALAQAQSWLTKRREDLVTIDQAFIDQSVAHDAIERSKQKKLRRGRKRAVGAAVFGILAIGISAIAIALWFDRQTQRREVSVMTSVADRSIAEGDFERGMRAALQSLPAPFRVLGWSVPERLLMPTRLGWSDPEMRGLEARLAGAAQMAPFRIELRKHAKPVNSAAFSPDGAHIVTASNDRTARVWDARTGAELFSLKGHEDELRTAAFSPDGTRIVTASNDKTARIWDLGTRKEILRCHHDDLVFSAAFNRDGTRIVTASKDGMARIWDAARADNGRPLVQLVGHGRPVTSAAFNPTGKRVVTASVDHTARVWDAESGDTVLQLKGHRTAVRRASFSHDGTRIVTASYDKSVRIWDAETGAELAQIRGHDLAVKSAVFGPYDQKIVTASNDGMIRIWDVSNISDEYEIWDNRSARMLSELAGHRKEVVTAEFSPDGKRVVSASEDHTARVWYAESTPETYAVLAEDHKILSAKLSPDGKQIATASSATAHVYDADGRKLVSLTGHNAIIRSLVFTSDGDWIVTASKDKTVRVWDAQTGEEKKGLRLSYTAPLHGAAVGTDTKERRIAAVAADGVILLWNTATKKILWKRKGHIDKIWGVAFSSDGKRIVTASEDSKAKVWDARTGSLLREIKVEVEGRESGSAPIWSAAFSPDGTRIVTGSWDRKARVWDAKSGKELIEMEHPGLVFYAEFSPDGERVITAAGSGGSGDDRAWIWDAETGALVAELKGHRGQVRHASFSLDGKKVVTASEDRTARVWDTSWIAAMYGEQLARKVCSERLVGAAQRFSERDVAADPALGGLELRSACAAHK